MREEEEEPCDERLEDGFCRSEYSLSCVETESKSDSRAICASALWGTADRRRNLRRWRKRYIVQLVLSIQPPCK